MINMINSRMASHTQWVDSLTITFIPTTEDSDVIGSVTAAMTARRGGDGYLGVGTRTVELSNANQKSQPRVADVGDGLVLVEHVLHQVQALGGCESGQLDARR